MPSRQCDLSTASVLLRAVVGAQLGDSGTLRRMYRTSSAGITPTINMPRQPMYLSLIHIYRNPD